MICRADALVDGPYELTCCGLPGSEVTDAVSASLAADQKSRAGQGSLDNTGGSTGNHSSEIPPTA